MSEHANYTRDQLIALTAQVGELAVASDQHDLALSALLSAYCTVAMAHPCCLQECANQTFKLSMMLAAEAAQRAQSPHVH